MNTLKRQDSWEEETPLPRPLSQESCQRAINRLTDETADFNSIFEAAPTQSEEWKFTDESFLFPHTIHWEDVPAVMWPLDGDVPYISWERISERYWSDDYSMWGSDHINPEDAIQGQLGNCWLIVAAMSIAEDPERIKDLFLVDEKNSVGVYAATIYQLGMPVTVIVDDYLPLTQDGTEPRYGKEGKDGALWGTIFEKVFAKYLGNYEAIDAGIGSHGIEAMTGAPFSQHMHWSVIDQGTEKTLWNELIASNTNNMMVTSGSYNGTGSDQDTNEFGLPYTHAFSIMNALEVTDADGNQHRLVCIRNPWGREKYYGPWSDSSDLWTEDMREQANHLSDENDGKYFMAFEDYVQQMEFTHFSLNVAEMHHTGFLFEGDDEPVNRQQVFDGPSTKYNVHQLEITSSEPQQISLSGHTYNFKQYHGACLDNFSQASVLMELNQSGVKNPVWPGSHHEMAIEISEDSPLTVQFYTQYSEDDILPHDWSLVVWSEKSPVKIEHKDGFESSSFRNLSPDPTIPIPTDFREPEPKFASEITDYSTMNPHIFDVMVKTEEFTLTERMQIHEDNLTEVTDLEIPGLGLSKISATWTYDQSSETLEMTTSQGEGIKCYLAEVGFCSFSGQINPDWLISAEVQRDDEGLAYVKVSQNAGYLPQLSMAKYVNVQKQQINVEVFYEDEKILGKTWDFLLPSEAWNFPFQYEFEDKDASGQSYQFKELLHIHSTHEVFKFEVVGKERYAGEITTLYSDTPTKLKIYFGTAAAVCELQDDNSDCSLEMTDPESGLQLFFSYQDWTYIVSTPEVHMISTYILTDEQPIYTRTNEFTDSTILSQQWNVQEEYEKYLTGDQDDSKDENGDDLFDDDGEDEDVDDFFGDDSEDEDDDDSSSTDESNFTLETELDEATLEYAQWEVDLTYLDSDGEADSIRIYSWAQHDSATSIYQSFEIYSENHPTYEGEYQYVYRNETQTTIIFRNIDDYEDTVISFGQPGVLNSTTYRIYFDHSIEITQSGVDQTLIEKVVLFSHPELVYTIQYDFGGEFPVLTQEVSYTVDTGEVLVQESQPWYFGEGGFTGEGPFEGGPFGEESDEVDQDDWQTVYDSGFDSGYKEGYEEGVLNGDDGSVSLDYETLVYFADQFPTWVQDQTLKSDSVFGCGYDIRLAAPFAGPFADQTDQITALVANQDCSDWTLLLTLVLDRSTQENIIGFSGADLSSAGCVDLDEFKDTMACEFELESGGNNFGVMFQGGLNPVFYSTEWIKAKKEQSSFSWW